MSRVPDVEKDHAGSDSVNGNGRYNDHEHLHHDHHTEESALRRMRTAGSVTITPELFEKIYLSPKNRVSNNIRSTFGNPTPLAIVGFLISLTPLSNVLLGWRGSGGLGAAEVGIYYFFGGLLMVLGGFLEFILGNTFPFVVFSSFGAFWLAFGATLTPYFNASAAYLPSDPAAASSDPVFASTFAFFHVYMGVLCAVYLVVALRTNIIFVLIFATLVGAFACLAEFFFSIGNSDPQIKYQHAAGGLTFVTSLLGWYLFIVQLLAAVDFPINLPVGDLSGLIKGASERAAAKEE